MWQLFIATFLDWWGNPIWSSLIKFDQVWSSLIHFGLIWSKKIKNKTAIFILSVSVTFYSNIFRLVRNPIWSSLIHFGLIWSKKNQKWIGHCYIFILFKNVTTNIFSDRQNTDRQKHAPNSSLDIGNIWSESEERKKLEETRSKVPRS